MQSEQLASVLAELGESVELKPEELAHLIEDTLAGTYRRTHPESDGVVTAHVDLASGAWDLTAISGDGEITDIPVDSELAWKCARAVRAAMAHRSHDVDMDVLVRDAEALRGQLVDGIVESRQGSNWMLRVGEHFALLTPDQQIPGEELRLHQHLKVVVLGSKRRQRDAVLLVSRSDSQLIQLLVAQEVPEVVSGQVVIKAIAREPGRRTKVAVSAPREDVDPRGACIGPKGVRHRALTQELSGEQVQFVTWSDDLATYIGTALAPATVHSVELEPTTRTATVVVAPDQLSLAIGKGGENARLVARLSGWRIDIHGGAGAGAVGEPGA